MHRLSRFAVAVGIAAALVLVAGCGQGPTAKPDARSAAVAGVVLLVPGCPVERVGDPCPAGRAAGIPVELRKDGVVVAKGSTDSSGRFRLDSPTGTVVVSAGTPSGLPLQISRRVEAKAGETTLMRLRVDSGIR